MKKDISCGIIFQDVMNNILIIRPTNGFYYQIPKGIANKQEFYWDVAGRESFEETGIDVDKLYILNNENLGLFEYKKDKDLYLFRLTLPKLPDINELYCKSTFFNHAKGLRELEVDDYKIINVFDYTRWLNRNLVKVFDKIYKG